MPPYRSGPGNGLFGSHAYSDSRPKIDVGGALDAFTQGASTLIQAAYQRKLLERQMAQQEQQMEIQRQHLGIEQSREARESANQEREFGLKDRAEQHRALEAGITPATTTYDTTPSSIDFSREFNPALSTPAPSGGSDIARAMSANVPSSVAPQSQQPLTTSGMRLKTTPESFDPTKAAAYQRGVSVQQLKNEGYMTKEEADAAARARLSEAHDQRVASMRQSAQAWGTALARLKAALATTKGGIAKAMSGTQEEKGRVAAGLDLIDNAGGSYDDAVRFLNSDEGKVLRERGVTPYHLYQAHAQYVDRTSAQAGRLQTGLFSVPADSAVNVVKGTRRQLAQPNVTPQATPSQWPQLQPITSPFATAGGSVPLTGKATGDIDLREPVQAPIKAVVRPGVKTSAPPAPAPGTPRAAPVATPATHAPSAAASAVPAKDDFTDDEIADALKAGKSSAADVAAFIAGQRKKKRGGSD